MTDDLSLLSPAARAALSEMDGYMDSVLGEYPEGSAAWAALRAELLRLASAEAELAKLRARVEDAHKVHEFLYAVCAIYEGADEHEAEVEYVDLTGKRVALVKLDDGGA